MLLVVVLLYKLHKRYREDNNGDFRKRCRRVRLEKWRRVPVNVSGCLLTSHPIPNVILTFAPLAWFSRYMKTPNGIM